MGWSSKYMLLLQWVYTPFNSYVSNSSENRWFGVRPTISRKSEARLPIPEFEWVLWSSSKWLLKPLGLQQKVCQTHLHYVEFSLFSSNVNGSTQGSILVISGKILKWSMGFSTGQYCKPWKIHDDSHPLFVETINRSLWKLHAIDVGSTQC